MNKKISWCFCAVFVLVMTLFSGCKGGNNEVKVEVPAEEVKVDNMQMMQDIKQAEKIFQSLPSPIESAALIKSAGARFEESLLNSDKNVSSYVSTRSMALNLGIYTCDLSFASLYEQTQLIVNYMNAAKKMADGLGILKAIEQSQIDKLEENINNSDVIMDIVSETFMNSNSYLEENQQPAIAAMVLVGGWVEGLYISTQLVDMKDFDGNKLVGRIVDQKLSIDILFNLLERSKDDPLVKEIIDQLQKLRTSFDRIKLTTTPIKTEFDKTSNSTYLKSEVTTDMTPATFRELASTVSEIRASFVK